MANKMMRAGKGGGAGTQIIEPLSINMTDRSIRVNLSLLPAPTNVYDADVWSMRREAGYVSLYFGQLENAGSTALRSRLRIKLPAERFVSGFFEQSRDFHQGLNALLAKLPVDPLEPDLVDISAMPVGRDHSVWANFDYMSRSGNQATFDFYNLSTAGLARYVQNQGTGSLVLDPVARVSTTLRQMGAILDASERLVPEVKQYLPEGEM